MPAKLRNTCAACWRPWPLRMLACRSLRNVSVSGSTAAFIQVIGASSIVESADFRTSQISRIPQRVAAIR